MLLMQLREQTRDEAYERINAATLQAEAARRAAFPPSVHSERMFHRLADVSAEPEGPAGRKKRVVESFGRGVPLRSDRPDGCSICLEAFVCLGKSKCSVCKGDKKRCASDLRDKCIAVLPCRHAVCAACLVDYRVQSRRPESEEVRMDFLEVWETENSTRVPLRPETAFSCTECQRPIADDIVEQLAAALFEQESFLCELSSTYIRVDGAEKARRLIVTHKFDVPKV